MKRTEAWEKCRLLSNDLVDNIVHQVFFNSTLSENNDDTYIQNITDILNDVNNINVWSKESKLTPLELRLTLFRRFEKKDEELRAMIGTSLEVFHCLHNGEKEFENLRITDHLVELTSNVLHSFVINFIPVLKIRNSFTSKDIYSFVVMVFGFGGLKVNSSL